MVLAGSGTLHAGNRTFGILPREREDDRGRSKNGAHRLPGANHANYIRNLAPYIVDEPPGLLGDDTAPNPSEASLAALGSCLAVGLHANAVHRGWIVNKLELELEGDLNITAVWGTGDVSEKPVGFTDVRVKVDMECEGVPKSEIDALVNHVKKWSPVANTFTRPVNLEVSA